MSVPPAKEAINPPFEVPSSPVAEEPGSDPASSFHCVVEDVHGRPASRPLSFSLTPERTSMLQLHQPAVSPSSFVSPVYDKELLLSTNDFPSPDQIDLFHHGANAVTAGAGVAAVGGLVAPMRSSAASHSRNGYTTLASSVSGLHVTQSGIVIPPIQGIPQPKGLPTPTPVQYAKVKGKGNVGQKRSRLAAKGAFSNMTSVAVLQQVQPFQKKTRQVEAAGWSRLDYTGDECEPNLDEPKQNVAVRAAVADCEAPPSANLQPTQHDAVQPSPAIEAGGYAQVATSQHARSASGDSLTPSEAAMVAAAWEEDVAAAAAQVHCESDDDWDRAEEEAMRIQAQMLQQQQQQQQQQSSASQLSSAADHCQETPKAPTVLQEAFTTPSHFHSPVAMPHHSDPTEEMPPYAIRTAASANRSPTHTRVSPHHQPSSGRDIYSAHGLGSPNGNAYDSGSVTGSGRPIHVTDTAHSAVKPTHHHHHNNNNSSIISKPYPVGFEAFVEKGQQRRAEAERAQLERTALATGEPQPDVSNKKVADEANVKKRVAAHARKMSVGPTPRGLDAFAQKGHARRAEVERREEQRRRDDAANCTHAPRINQRGSLSSATTGGGSRKMSYASTAAATTAATDAAASAPRVRSAAPSGEEGGPRVSVFERLSKEADVREERLRQLEQKFTPSFTPHRITAVTAIAGGEGSGTAVEDNGDVSAILRKKSRGHGQSVFDSLYSLAKKPTTSPPARGVAQSTSAHATVDSDAEVGGTNTSAAAAATALVEEDTAKKPKAEIEQHILSMQSRDEERRVRWEQHLAAQAAEEKARAHHPALNPNTSDLAERARARYRVLEELKKQQDVEAAKHHAVEGDRAKRMEHRRQKQQGTHPVSSSQPAAAPPSAKTKTTEREGEAPPRQQDTSAMMITPARRSLGADFLEHQQKTEERKTRHLEQLRLQRADAELQACTFRPRLNAASEKIARRVLVASYEPPEGVDSESPRTANFSKPTSPQEAGLPGRSLTHSVDLSCHNGQSPLVSARSRSLLHELRSASPTQMQPQRLQSASVKNDEEEEENFTLRVQDVPAADAVTPTRSPEPLSAQLRNLEEMLREWKELERECSPMLRQQPEAGVVE